MKKLKFNYLLALLPLAMVLIASGPSGVTVFDGTNTAYYSWHQMVQKSSFGWCAPMAVVMNYVVFALAVIYLLKKKSWCLTVIYYLAFAAGCVAVLPIVIQSDIKVIPNVMGVIVLMSESLAAKLVMKKLPEEKTGNKNAGRRLERR